jgi:hypothetical protein
MVKRLREIILEGNPLARVQHNVETGRHFVGISAVRPNYSKAENEKRMHELKTKVRSMGYGFRPAKGEWEGGSEDSIVVNAKKSGDDSGSELRKDMSSLASHYEQDAIFHHNGKSGKLIGTNDTGYPGKGKEENVGKVKYNKPHAPFQTALKPRRPEKDRPKFTTE